METVAELPDEVSQMGSMTLDDKGCEDVQEVFILSDDEKSACPDEGEHEKSCDLDKLPTDMRGIIQGETRDWGQCIEFECPTNSACIKVDKLLAQPVPAPALVEPAVTCAPGSEAKLRELTSKVRDCEDALSRYGILFEQAVQRIDGQLGYMVNWQRNAVKVQDDLRRKTDALVAEVGLDAVKARLQQMEVENHHRNHQRFGHVRARSDLQFSMDMPPQQMEPVVRHPLGEHSYNRRGRGNRRGGGRY